MFFASDGVSYEMRFRKIIDLIAQVYPQRKTQPSHLSGPDSFRLLVDGIRDYAIFLLDLDGRVAIWNAGAQRMQTYTEDEAMGVQFAFFFHNDDIQNARPYELLQRATREGSAEHEGYIYRKDGSRFLAKMILTALRAETGEICGFATVIHDLTEQKSIEELLKQAKETAESANRAKATFLANISHEIRTPLGAILGFAELLKDSSLSQDERDSYLSNIQRNGVQLTNLVNDLLDLSKIEAQRLEFENIEFNMVDALNDVSSVAKAAISAKKSNIDFRLETSGNMPEFVLSDPTRVKQILMNLVSNAIKFTENGWVQLHVNFTKGSGDKQADLMTFTVSDSGIGMTPEAQKKIFQPFSQADESVSRRYGGTGLGLVLSLQLAKQMGGELRLLRSAPDQGSEFQVSIPLRAVLRDRPILANASAPDTAIPSLSGLRVLLVEDSRDNQLLIERFLSLADAHVSVVNNGLEAIETALAQEFDIVLMDVQMPLMDGIQATQQLRKMKYNKPIIAVTAHALQQEVESCLKAGYTDHIVKPVSRHLLLSKVVQYARQMTSDLESARL